MNIRSGIEQDVRRTAADEIFRQLYADIVELKLPPGTKLSESDIAKQSDVSRQPVREAFIRLNNMGLLTIRPQKATLVSKISETDVMHANFIRMAVEVEVVRKACEQATDIDFQRFETNLAEQKAAALDNKAAEFHSLDYDFHRFICQAANSEFAFTTIAKNKSQVDRLGTLRLANKENMLELTEDHSEIVNALENRDVVNAIALTRTHLSRLKLTVQKARERFGDYFED